MVNQSPNPSSKLYRYIQVIIVHFYTAEFDTNHTNYMNLMSKYYLISLMSKVLERNDVTQLLKKSDHVTPYSHGLLPDTILLQWFPYNLLQHYISIYVDIFWKVTLSSITMQFYAFPHALLHNPTITHHGQAQRFNQATIHTSLPDILSFKCC